MDDDFKMDAAEIERYEAWTAAKWKHGPCPVCGVSQWSRNQRIGHIPNEKTAKDGTAYAVLPVYCRNCGYTVLINAVVAGIRPLP